jgi:membrane-associated phospholipid phosphatase
LFVLGGGICIFLAAIVSIWWQISAHMIGIGGLLGALIAFCYYLQMPIFFPISICIFIAGLIGFARLQLRAHVPSQIYVGFFVGCIMQFCLFGLAQQIKFL